MKIQSSYYKARAKGIQFNKSYQNAHYNYFANQCRVTHTSHTSLVSETAVNNILLLIFPTTQSLPWRCLLKTRDTGLSYILQQNKWGINVFETCFFNVVEIQHFDMKLIVVLCTKKKMKIKSDFPDCIKLIYRCS